MYIENKAFDAKKGMDYFDFGYVVGSCPVNKTGQKEAASRLKCGVDQFGNSQYLCVPNFRKTAIVEYCYKGTVGLQNPGSCLVVNNEGVVDIISCRSFTEGCTTTHFKSSELYQYPACHQINRKERCFNADPKCPKTETEMTTRTRTYVETCTTMNNSATTLGFSDTTDLTETGQIPAGAIAAFTIALFTTLAILFFIYIINLRKENKKRRGKSSTPSSDEENKLLYLKGDPEILKEIKTRENKLLYSKDNGEISKEENTKETALAPGNYSSWITSLSDQFSTLTDNEVSVLFCFMCSDSGPPDFTDTDWLELLNEIRQKVYREENPVTREEAQQTLNRLKSRDLILDHQNKITEDTKDETMYRIALLDSNIPFIFSSYNTASMYLRPPEYKRKPREKCVISSGFDPLLIRRLQMNILTHTNITIEDLNIFDKIYQILNVSNQILNEGKEKRKEFLMDLLRGGESVHYRGRAKDSVDHVKWLWRHNYRARPDIVRSCIGLHPHNDIYIIDNKAFRKPSKYHEYTPKTRRLLYCLLLVGGYTLTIGDDSYKDMLNKLSDRYFKEEKMSNEISIADLPEEIMQKENNAITFTSEDIRHDVMYAFVTECLIDDSDMEFFLKTASGHVITEYCRSWGYDRRKGERCLYIPDKPEMLDPVIERLQHDILNYCSISDRRILHKIILHLKIPENELLRDQEC